MAIFDGRYGCYVRSLKYLRTRSFAFPAGWSFGDHRRRIIGGKVLVPALGFFLAVVYLPITHGRRRVRIGERKNTPGAAYESRLRKC